MQGVVQLLYSFEIFIYLYLALPGLSCGTQDLHVA